MSAPPRRSPQHQSNSFAGSVASQLVGKAIGVTDSFSLRQAVGSGLTAGLTAGAGAALSGASGTLSKVLSAEGWRGAAGNAVLTSLTGQAGSRLARLDTSFSWRSVAANAVAASLSSSVTSRLSQSLKLDLTTDAGQFGQDLLGGAVGGVVSMHTRRAAGVGQRVDYGQVAVDAFGNALANAATGEHSRRALATLEHQHRADLINAELQGRLANGELQGAARAQALSRLGLPSDPKAHDGLWDRLPADGSRVLLDQRQGSNANGTPWTEQDWARRINDSFERQRFGGARVDFNTIRTDGVRDRRPAQVEALPAFIAAPPRSPGWSLSQQIWLNAARGTGAVVGVGKMFYDAAEGTVVGARTFAQAGMYQIGLAGAFDRWMGGNSYTMAGLQAGDRIGAGIQGMLDFAGSDYKGQIIADGIFSRFDDAAAKLSSQDPWTAFMGGIGIGQLTGEVGTSVYGGFQMARGGVGFVGRAADNFADLSKGKLYSLEGALGDVAKAAWDAALGKRAGGVAETTTRYQQYMALRAQGLSATDAVAAMSGKVSVAKLSDGTIVASVGKSAHLEARLVGDGVLYIDSTHVASPLRGQGISNQLFRQVLAHAGPQNVKIVRSYFGPGTNRDVVRAGIESGLTPSQAAALTPRGRTVIQSGFTNVQYDPFTGVFSASRW